MVEIVGIVTETKQNTVIAPRFKLRGLATENDTLFVAILFPLLCETYRTYFSPLQMNMRLVERINKQMPHCAHNFAIFFFFRFKFIKLGLQKNGYYNRFLKRNAIDPLGEYF